MKWKHLFVIAVVAMLLGACGSSKKASMPMATIGPAERTGQAESNDVNPRVLIIFYDSAEGPKPLLKAVKERRCEVIYEYKILKGMAISLPEGANPQAERSYFRKVKGVLSVEFDRKMQLD